MLLKLEPCPKTPSVIPRYVWFIPVNLALKLRDETANRLIWRRRGRRFVTSTYRESVTPKFLDYPFTSIFVKHLTFHTIVIINLSTERSTFYGLPYFVQSM